MPGTRSRDHRPGNRRCAARAVVSASFWVALALAGCQLPVAFGGFGVFATGSNDGSRSTSPPDGQEPGEGGPGGNTTVSTTGGGVPRGDISVSGIARLDDRTAHGGIDVTLRSGERSTTKRTDAEGMYRFDGVAPGPYQFEAAKEGYTSERRDVFLERDHQQLPQISLTSPVVAIELSAATDTLYVAPADPKDFAILPTTVQLKARLAKKNGDRLDGNVSTIAWTSKNPALAGVNDEGLVSALPNAEGGLVEILAASRANPTVTAAISLNVRDPGSIADVRVLSLARPSGGPR